MTYKQFIDLWLKDYAYKQIEQTSIERRESSLTNLILPAIGHLKLAKIQPLQHKVLFHLALFGGFRLGELIALTWGDVNFTENTISITKSTARTKDGMITKTPKTLSSIRTVNIPTDTIKLLRKHKIEQSKYRLALGTAWHGDNYLFIQDDGKQMDLATPNHTFKKIIKRYNKTKTDLEPLPEITLHGLRHTSTTLLIAQNIDVRTVSNSPWSCRMLYNYEHLRPCATKKRRTGSRFSRESVPEKSVI